MIIEVMMNMKDREKLKIWMIIKGSGGNEYEREK